MFYPAVIKQGKDGRWLVSFPDFPEALTDGAILSEAVDEAGDCLEKEARRLLDPHYGSKLLKMKQAFDALGKRIVIGVEDKEDKIKAA